MAHEFVYLSFAEEDRDTVLNIRLRAMNPRYPGYEFAAKFPLLRASSDSDEFRDHIAKLMKITSKTIVLIGEEAYKSPWIPHEVDITLKQGKPVYAIKLSDTVKDIPKCLEEHDIEVHNWSEETLNELANA